VRLLVHSSTCIGFEGLRAAMQPAHQLERVDALEGIAAAAARFAPHVILVDVDGSGPGMVDRQTLRHEKVVLWCRRLQMERDLEAMEWGARAVMVKTLPLALQMECLERVHLGELWFDPDFAKQAFHQKRIALTPRERDLLGLLVQGMKNKEIAFALITAKGTPLAEGTVKVLFSRLARKIGVKDRFDLALWALKERIGPPQVAQMPAEFLEPRLRA
jgi:two-component system nitrate/nitrite response regulator NarL